MPCSQNIPCPEFYVAYKMKNGNTCCRKMSKKAKKIEAKRLGVSLAGNQPKKVVSGFSLTDAKKKLRRSYGITLNGKLRAPGFITTLEGVSGKKPSEKIAKVVRVLSTCKKLGVPLLTSNGKKFKSYRTLVSQCKVTFRSTPKGVHLSNLIAKMKARKANRQLALTYVPDFLTGATEATGATGATEAAPLPDLIDLSEPVAMASFGKRRKVSRKVKSSKKLPKKVLKLCKKLKIKTTVKRGSKRVYKKLSVHKKQIKMKMKKH